MRRVILYGMAAVSLLVGAGFGALWVRSHENDDAVVVNGLFEQTQLSAGTMGGRVYLRGFECHLFSQFECELRNDVVRDFDWSAQDARADGGLGFTRRGSLTPIWHWELTAPLWFPVALSAAAAGLFVWLARRPTPAAGCPACGYDLRATPGRCPECGAEPTAAAAARARRRAVIRALVASVACVGFLWFLSRVIGERDTDELPTPVIASIALPAVVSAWIAFRSAMHVVGRRVPDHTSLAT